MLILVDTYYVLISLSALYTSVNAGPVDEEIVNAKVSAMLDDQDSGLLSSLATECLRPVLGDALVSNVKVAEITDIMVSMSKNDIQVRKTLLGLLGLLGLLFECFGWVYFFGGTLGYFFLIDFVFHPPLLPSSSSSSSSSFNLFLQSPSISFNFLQFPSISFLFLAGTGRGKCHGHGSGQNQSNGTGEGKGSGTTQSAESE